MTAFKYVSEQYDEVKASRHVVFEFCKSISPSDLLNENSSFGRGGSIRNLLIHIANVYEFWIADKALKKKPGFTAYEDASTIAEIINVYNNVDHYMNEFIELFQSSGNTTISYELNNAGSSTGILKLFTHVITHEFHHKGQVLSLSRHLGYVPVDTDIIR